MHEWLSGGASPCQGEGRGFESRLVLNRNRKHYVCGFLFLKLAGIPITIPAFFVFLYCFILIIEYLH